MNKILKLIGRKKELFFKGIESSVNILVIKNNVFSKYLFSSASLERIL